MTPDGWTHKPLVQVATIVTGQSPPGNAYNADRNGMPLLNGPTEFGPASPSPVQWTSVVTKTCRAGDILFCVRGSTTGRQNVADQNYCIGRGLAAIRGTTDLSDTQFLRHVLAALAKQVLEEARGAGSTFPNITADRLENLAVLLPPFMEQRKIAAILSSVDDVIEASQSVIDQLQVVKKAMMADLLTKGLPGRHKKFKQTEIGVLPEDWVVAKLGDLADIAYGLTVNGQRRNSATHRPYLTVANLQDDQFDLAEVKQIGVLDGDEERYAVRQGDVLLVEGNANIERLGRAAIWTGQLPLALHQNHLIRVRVGQAALTPAWVHLVLGACAVREQIESHAKTSSGLNTINSTVVAGLSVAVPSPEEQVAICDIRGGIQTRLMAESLSMSALRAVKSALMSVLLTGEVRVRVDEEAGA